MSTLEEDVEKCSTLDLIETIIRYYYNKKQVVKYFRTSKGICLSNLKFYDTPVFKKFSDYAVSDNCQKMMDQVFTLTKKDEKLIMKPIFDEYNTRTIYHVSDDEYNIQYKDLTLDIYSSWDPSVVQKSFIFLESLNSSNRLYEEYSSLFNLRDLDYKKRVNFYYANSTKLDPLVLVKAYYNLKDEDDLNNSLLKSALKICRANFKKLKNVCYLGNYTHQGTSPRIKPANSLNSMITLSNVSKVTRLGVLNFLSENLDMYRVMTLIYLAAMQ